MKKYKDIDIYDFSDYAEEITGDALFKINGGEQIQNSIKAQANANVGDTVTNSKGETHTLTQADINWAQQQLGINGNTPTGSNNAQNPGSGATSGYNPGSSSGPTQPSTPDVPEEIKANPHAYANYMALQEQAKAEGNPDKYKGYNVLGVKSIDETNITPLKLLSEVLGQNGVDIWNSVSKHTLSVNGRSGSFPLIGICYDEDTMQNPLSDVNTFVHEVYHQVQYETKSGSLGKLIKEFIINEKKSVVDKIYDYTYEYDSSNLEKYQSLSDLPYLESQAQFVGDYGSLYYESRYGFGLAASEMYKLQQMTEIMCNSGYSNTEAVNWIKK